MNISDALQTAYDRLASSSDAPELDARWLLGHVLGRDETSWLLAHSDEQLSSAAAYQYESLVAARAAGKPLAYMLGEWGFYGRYFWLNENVLIPRPETENLLVAALAYIREAPPFCAARADESLVVADIGTGSGVIAITLLLEAPASHIHIIATDISPDALQMARKNARRHGVEDKIEFIHGDMLSPLAGKQIDLIVSNPPYVPTHEINVADPLVAVDGGPDGRKFTRQLEGCSMPAVFETINGKIQWNDSFEKKRSGTRFKGEFPLRGKIF